MVRPKVMVSGCFDLLHSGHIAFLQSASEYGDVVVCIGSDQTVSDLKDRWPVTNQNERKYMLEALRSVSEVRISRGSGHLDFEPELAEIRPKTFVVNHDGDTPEKAALCASYGVEYVVLPREPHQGLTARSTTALRQECHIPYRIDIAGGWLDQPFVSQHHPGPMITISIEPTHDFNDRSGMSTSTRRKAIELWRTHLPPGDLEIIAKVLFCCENPPGSEYISGSQDSIGIVYPGLNKLHYQGQYWPDKIESVHDESILTFLESHLHLVPLSPRSAGFRVLDKTCENAADAMRLADAANDAWDALMAKDAAAFGDAFRRSFEAQVAMFPYMVDSFIEDAIKEHGPHSLGYKLSGAGGGGYLILVRPEPYPGALRIKIRRRGTI
ncbi:MAG: adenylyltransferase/cytidyltransferase family protein [Armatimonadetes bacterium]|nr:adenylyltransferase/cytidyltransferase family protein [Armatimonadota bacterium]